jgi:hypothetical protein
MVAVVALEVEHRVDADAVRVRAGARTHDHDRAPEALAREGFDLVLAHVLDVEALALQQREVNGLCTAPVHDEVRVALRQLLVVDDLRLLEAHRRRQLQRRPACGERVRDRQREAHLHEAVVEVVGVRAHRGQVDLMHGRPPARAGGGHA